MTYASLVAAIHDRVHEVVRGETAAKTRMAWGQAEARWRFDSHYVRLVNVESAVLVSRGFRGLNASDGSLEAHPIEPATVDVVLDHIRWMETSADDASLRFGRYEQRA
jgi:hypothetical protein